jgi:peptidoglycan/xylan/chitin deacetylase (PgdA/CDA1 family)
MGNHERDLIGYGPNPPHAQWPDGARIAVNFLMNFEEGGEPSVQDGDGYSETLLTELGVMSTGIRGRDLCAEDMFAYGTRVAFWRLMRLLSDRGIRVSINGTALALERHPDAARALGEAGHDICGHGYRWLKQYDMPEEEEREQIRKAVASITRTVGELRTKSQHPAAARGGRRLPVRLRLVRRRVTVLDQGRRKSVPRRSVHAYDQRHQVRPGRHDDRQRLLRVLPGRIRRALP